jgi:predicted ATPase with chaperone activity
MLARRLTTILPDMTLAEALETTRVQSVAGRAGDRTAVVTTRPFRAPHHTISDVVLIGGGQVPLPGGVLRAHHAMLVLGERPACRHHVLEVLRQPLEEGVTYLQSRGRPRLQCYCDLRRMRHDRRGLPQRTIAAPHLRGDRHPRGITTSLLPSNLCSRLTLFA